MLPGRAQPILDTPVTPRRHGRRSAGARGDSLIIPAMTLRDAGHMLANQIPRVLAAVTARMPMPMAEAAGASFGALFEVLPNRVRRQSRVNLERAFGERSVASLGALRLQALKHSGREAGATLRWFARGPDELPSACENYAELVEIIRRDLHPGRGAIYVGAHFGNPQLLSALCATVVPVTGVGNAYHTRRHLSFIAEGRQRLGVRYIPDTAPPLDLLRALQRNELVTFLPDSQPRRNSGVWLPFLGTPACTTTFPASLARLTGCVLRPVYLVREGRHYRAILRDAIAPPRLERGDADIERVMLEWTATLEEEIRRRPEQWVWMSRRWRPVPPGARVVERRAEPAVASPAGRAAERAALRPTETPLQRHAEGCAS